MTKRRLLPALLVLVAGLAAFLLLARPAPETGLPGASPPAGAAPLDAEARLEGVGTPPAAPPGASAAEVAGIVVHHDGSPAPDVLVVARRDASVTTRSLLGTLEQGFAPASDATPVAETRSQEDGTFRLAGLDTEARYLFVACPEAPRLGTGLLGTPRDLAGERVRLVVAEGTPLRGRVVDGRGRGLASWVSASVYEGPFRWRPGRASVALKDLPTDGEGRFLIDALPAGPASLHVRIPGRIARWFPVVLPCAEEVVLALYTGDGAALEGAVRDAAGAAVAGARLEIRIAPPVGGPGPGTTLYATTDALGTWRAEDLEPGRLETVLALADGFLPAAVNGAHRPLTAGAPERVDVVLSCGATVTGTVRDPAGAPLEDVHVAALVMGSGMMRPEAVSDAQGRYVLAPLPLRDLLLQVRRDGWYLPAQSAEGPAGVRPSSLEVRAGGEGSTTVVDVVLRRGVRLEGRCVDASGAGRAGLRVEANAETGRDYALGGQLAEPPPSATTDAEGRFAFAGLAPFVGWTLQAAGAGWWGRAKVEPLEPDVAALPIEIDVHPTAGVEGRIVMRSGGALVDQALYVSVRPTVEGLSAYAEQDGSFVLRDLPAGRYELRPLGGAGRSLGEPVALVLDWGQVVREIRLEIRDPQRVSGVVMDAEGRPLDRTPLRITDASVGGLLAAETVTDEEGRFELMVWGEGPFAASARGRPLEGTFTGGTTDVRLVLGTREASNLVVRILDPDGDPVPRSRVRVTRWQGRSGSTTVHDVVGGRLVLRRSDLEPRTDVQVADPCDAEGRPLGALEARADNVQETSDPELVIRLEWGAVLRGRVLDADGDPVAGVRVSARSERGATIGRSTRTDAEGGFTIAGLPPDTTRALLHAFPDAPWLPPPPVEVAPLDVEVVIRLQRGVALHVRVLSPAGEAVERLQVALEGTQGDRTWHRSAETDGAGEVVVDGVPEEGVFTATATDRTARPRFPRQVFRDLTFGDGSLVLRLRQGVFVRGEVVDEEGKPLARARVAGYRVDEGEDEARISTSLRDSAGFALGPLLPGRYRVSASGGREHAESMYVEVTAPAEGVRLVVPRAVTLVGRFLDEDREDVFAAFFAPDEFHLIQIESDGSFRCGRLRDEPGTLYVRVGDSSERYWVREDVRPSEGPFEVRLRDGSQVRGHFAHFPGLADEGPFVELGRGLLTLGGRVLEDGTFEVHAVPPGAYDLRVWYAGRVLVEMHGVEAGREDLVLDLPDLPDRR